ncbi:MAG TPA: serine/threonine-protein kinase, partial [Polyangiaceae bacterium]|nr:serine/threonine-protein kinase [Polyangiaceae bacterium]
MASDSDISEPSVSPLRPRNDLVGATVGTYRIMRVLGEGSVGIVYLAEHPLVGAKVAIKVLHEHSVDAPGVIERFINEAKAANRIQSPHIARVTNFDCLPDGRHYAVMEYLEGRTLEQLLNRAGRLGHLETAELCRQIATGMEAAHAAGIIHRDLKPANVLVQPGQDGKPFVRILDFGIAKLIESHWEGNAGDARGTLAGQILGTPLYCSPEQAAGEPVDTASDIYALGAIAYELLSGQAPIEGENLLQIFVRKSTTDARPIRELCPELPVEMAALVMEMLARDPEARPRSMVQVGRRLDGILGHTPSAAGVGAEDDIGLRATLASGRFSPAFDVPRLDTTSQSGALTVGTVSAPSSSPSMSGVDSVRLPRVSRGSRI